MAFAGVLLEWKHIQTGQTSFAPQIPAEALETTDIVEVRIDIDKNPEGDGNVYPHLIV